MKNFIFVLLICALALPMFQVAHAADPLPWTKPVDFFTSLPNLTKACTDQSGVPTNFCYNLSNDTYTAYPASGLCGDGFTPSVSCKAPAATTATPTTGSATTPASTASTPTTGTTASNAFVPLTNLPGIAGLTSVSQSSLPAIFNNLYKICIGLAATLAVLVIMKAGVEFMTNTGSISHNEKAKSDLQNAILGLVLVLSPAIVFGIIDPRILNLDIDLKGLQPDALNTVTATGLVTNDLGQTSNGKNDAGGPTVAPAPTLAGCTAYTNSTIIDASDNKQVACCTSQSTADKMVSCSVQQRSNSDLSATAYCGCTINPKTYDYQVYYLGPNNATDFSGFSLVGAVPSQKKTHDDIVTECNTAHGKVTDGPYHPGAEGVDVALHTNHKYRECPANAGFAADPAHSATCENWELVCSVAS